jgi:HD-GYP domain-containing protein (c-di-GMP phosphodiesterase class II)
VALGQIPGLGPPGAGPELAREQQRLLLWAQAVVDRMRLAEQLATQRQARGAQEEQLNRAWSALLGINDAIRQVRIHRDVAGTRELILQAAHSVLGVQAVVWVGGDGSALVVGEPLFADEDAPHLPALIGRSQAGNRPGEPTLCNQDSASAWSARFPGVVNVLSMPVPDGGKGGYLLALNRTAGDYPSPFRRSDAVALMPFASLLGLHARGGRRLHELKDLLVGLARSLTAAIDARDPYTYGHSERVARVAVELGRELGVAEEELSDFYLAGLLHDVGKIGVNDTVLAKTEPLTEQEFDELKRHVSVGYTILSELRQIRNLLPGVLHHHERYDGTGYPDGLSGQAIPLLARILAVADAYDAMGTSRPYRPAIPCGRVEEILREGAGRQWDPQVIEAFLRCRHRLHAIRQRGLGESLRRALDGALAKGDASTYAERPRRPEEDAAGTPDAECAVGE